MRRTLLLGAIALALALAACATGEGGTAAALVSIPETWVTPLDTAANVDGPAFVARAEGDPWVIASAKSADALIVYDATTGRELKRLGGSGKDEGRLERPNGLIVVGDSLLLVVERDNARVQAFSLPQLSSLGTFGAGELRVPYGITALTEADGSLSVYVTDNYETADERVPPIAELNRRVKVFRVLTVGGRVQGRLLRSFGDTTAAGAIRVTESIIVDPSHNRVLIAEELETDSHIKVYTLAGEFSGRRIGRGLFPQQAEGIALYACPEDEGYWVATDQGPRVNTFHILDRRTFRHLGSFRGEVTNTTDGVALTQRAFPGFPAGAFFAAHADAGISAFSWKGIAERLGLRSDCTTQ